jgi:cell division cycle 2-like protein
VKSDDRHSKEEGEHQSITTTEDDEVEEEPAPPPPHRSRFDDQDDEDEEEKNENESDRHHHHHRHHRHHHKRSRRHSSSTPASSSSKSAMTPPPVSNNHQIEKEFIDEKPQLPNYYPAIQGCRRVDEYSCLNRIEEGTYGVVFRAKDKKTGEIVALKRLKMEKEKEGFPITSLREICCILKSQHDNVCTVRVRVYLANFRISNNVFIVGNCCR